MARVRIKGRKTEPGLRFARVVAGLGAGHRPSNFNICVGKQLKGRKYTYGGMRSPEVQRAFVEAAARCGARISPSSVEKLGISASDLERWRTEGPTK